MTAEYKKLIQSVQSKNYAPVYLVDGEEPYYIDKIVSLFEETILQPAERDFNLSVLYGKDVQWADVVNACRRFPMFAERQVVILKEASAMRDLNELAGYVDKPSPSTVFLIAHNNKKVDARSKLAKLAKDKGIYFNSEKLKEDQLPQWIQSYGDQSGFRIGQKEAELLATYLGNDLQKITNEIEKIRINVPDEKELSGALIQKYIGISREYNVFELSETLTSGNKDKLYRMLTYFIANPKAAPMVLVTASFYSHFNTLYKVHYAAGKPDKEIAEAAGMSPYRVKHMVALCKKWPLHKVENCLTLLARYNTFTVGIDNNTSDTELLKEMIGKLELIGDN
jgi:DNA polymerase-3 subunit delta